MKKRNLVLIMVVLSLIALALIFLMEKDAFPVFNSDADQQVQEEFLFAIYGSEDKPLRNPASVAVSGKGLIYVTDSDNHQIVIFRPNGRFYKSFGKLGSGKGEFNYPVRIAVTADGLIYVSEINNHRIQVFDEEGKFLRFFPVDKQQLLAPTALTVDREGNVLVVDKSSHSIKKFNAEGKLLLSLGGPGNGDGRLAFPMDLSIDKQGRIYVADSGNSRIQVFDQKGKFVFKIEAPTNNVSVRFVVPRGIVVDDHQRVFVTDIMGNYVSQLMTDGTLIKAFGTTGEQNEQFYFPDGIDYSRGKLYIADKGNNRVVVYQMSR